MHAMAHGPGSYQAPNSAPNPGPVRGGPGRWDVGAAGREPNGSALKAARQAWPGEEVSCGCFEGGRGGGGLLSGPRLPFKRASVMRPLPTLQQGPPGGSAATGRARAATLLNRRPYCQMPARGVPEGTLGHGGNWVARGGGGEGGSFEPPQRRGGGSGKGSLVRPIPRG